MNLLIITQKVDKNDPILGFFHNWVLKLSEKFEEISVICLEKGECDLPKNVKVFSLGKENGRNKIKYVLNFFQFAFLSGLKYDSVLVHMNQEYVLLGGLLWKFLGKKVFLWRNHPQGSIFTKLAILLSCRVFYTSNYSYTARFKKGLMMPVGIDTDLFRYRDGASVAPNSILSIGRISPIKNIDRIIDAAIKIRNGGVQFKLDIMGSPVNPEDRKYLEKLLKKSGADFFCVPRPLFRQTLILSPQNSPSLHGIGRKK